MRPPWKPDPDAPKHVDCTGGKCQPIELWDYWSDDYLAKHMDLVEWVQRYYLAVIICTVVFILIAIIVVSWFVWFVISRRRERQTRYQADLEANDREMKVMGSRWQQKPPSPPPDDDGEYRDSVCGRFKTWWRRTFS